MIADGKAVVSDRVEFVDTDGDHIVLVVENGCVVSYLNGARDGVVQDLSFDVRSGTYTANGEGSVPEDPELRQRLDAFVKRQRDVPLVRQTQGAMDDEAILRNFLGADDFEKLNSIRTKIHDMVRTELVGSLIWMFSLVLLFRLFGRRRSFRSNVARVVKKFGSSSQQGSAPSIIICECFVCAESFVCGFALRTVGPNAAFALKRLE